MADDLSLLFKIKGDAAGAKQATAETRAAIAALQNSLGSNFKSIQTSGENALQGITDKLNIFVGQRIPLIGGAFVRITENLRGLGESGTQNLDKVEKTIGSLADKVGKTSSETKTFLTNFLQLGTQAERDAASVAFLGTAFDAKLIPQIEKAANELGEVAVSGEAATSAFAGMAAPLGIAALGIAAMGAAAAITAKEIFNLIESTAEFQGKLFDLSQQTGVSVETLSALEIIAKTTGGDIGSMTASLGIFQRKLEEAQDPLSKAAQTFADLGVNTNDTETALRQSLAALAKLPEGYRQTALALELYGRGGKTLLAITKESNGSLDEQIKKFRELGILISKEDAKAADEFNDQLTILGLQGRAALAQLAKDGIKPTHDAMVELSKTFRENKDAIGALGIAFGIFVTGNLKILEGGLVKITQFVGLLREAWAGVRAAAILAATGSIEAANATFEALKKNQPAAPGTTPSATTTTTGLSAQARRIQAEQTEGLKELAAEQQRLTADEISRATQIERNSQIVIGALKKELTARQEAIDAEVKLNSGLAESRRQAGDTSAAEELEKKNRALLQQRRDLQSEFDRKSREEETAARQESDRSFIDHQNTRTELIKRNNDFEIKLTEAKVRAGLLTELEGQQETERLQNASIEAQKETLQKELALHSLSKDQRQKLNDELKALEQEQTQNKKENAEKRKQIAQDEVNFERDLLLKRIDNELRLGDIRSNARIAAIKSLAALGVKTEEEAEREIARIRLEALDREIEAIKARQTAVGTILDPKARKAAEEQLNADLKAAQAEREALQEENERNTAEGLNRDLERRRRYRAEVQRLDQDIAAGDLAQRRRDLEILAQRTGLNAQIIAQFRQLTLDEAAERHRRVLDEIDSQEAEAHAVDIGNKNKLEIEQQYNKLREQENERFHKQQEDINKPGGAGVSGRPAPTAIEQLLTGLTERLSGGQLTAVRAGIEALTTAFSSLGEAIGQVVQAWVLYGKSGESIRQVTAQILASVAQQAAVKAVFELAEGFAALALSFFGIPNAGPSAAAHFQAAAIYGAIAGVAAIAGRGIAGNSFNQSNTASKTGGTSSGPPQPLQTIQTGRNQAPLQVLVVIRPDGTKFAEAVTAHIVENVGDGGQIRDVIQNDRRS